MKRLDAKGPLANAGRAVRQEIRRRHPEPEGAVQAVRDAMEDPSAVEEWASLMLRDPFMLAEMPAPMRQGALECLAAARLAWTYEQERRYA